MNREMSVNGSFYPANADEIQKYFEYFTKMYDDKHSLPNIKTRTVIVPHAGYVFSGYTANIAHRMLEHSGIKRFVVIGPSHRVAFHGVSMCPYEKYDTPFGSIESDQEIVNILQEKLQLSFFPQAHHEHSTEVQFPFLKYYIPDVKVVELVYSSAYSDTISEIIDLLLKQDDIGVIISTDLSHFYTLAEANTLDQVCVEAIENLDITKLHQGCEACGMIGVEGMIKSAKKSGMAGHILDYRTSAEMSHDEQSVVGYVSAYFS
ncbi:AmmeMemoRadiSam system protein B [Sulfurimonas microaerophilic]|uniref:AmmeMemoRadiSam system protein B n=1 Tax=Sulfurimonas microaerophilic TaxID=3058392 RepID=UPI0027147695|nr:AmmeMemoRadiSam system protein B [Sulfurimonas sp. hsl 1-7]